MAEYEHSKAMKHGAKEYVTHLTGKVAKSEALKRALKTQKELYNAAKRGKEKRPSLTQR